MNVRYPGSDTLLLRGDYSTILAATTPADTSLLYWLGNAWMGAFTTNKFDMKLAITTNRAVGCMQRVLALDSTYGNGSIHDFFISWYGSLPASMGGSAQKAQKHFEKSLAISGGLRASPYVALAVSVCVKQQDHTRFTSLLKQALQVDVSQPSPDRLANILAQNRARWLLAHIDDFFLLDEQNTPSEEQG
jgi:predicted anti-sigma-YlaC factor YlaD